MLAPLVQKRSRELARYHNTRSDPRERLLRMVQSARKRSKRSGQIVRLSKAWQARAAKQERCAVTGIMFDLSTKRGVVNPLAPSLDRIDASKPYTDKNTRLVLYFVNIAKSNWSDEQFRTLVLVAASNMRH